jgi:hypothetical protein
MDIYDFKRLGKAMRKSILGPGTGTGAEGNK